MSKPSLNDKLEAMCARFEEIEALIADPAVIGQRERYTSLLQEHGALRETVGQVRKLKRLRGQLAEAHELAGGETDEELRALALEEIAAIEPAEQALYEEIKQSFLVADEDDHRNVIVEIRAGIGGEEAGLFAADLFKMYSRFAERHRFKLELLTEQETELGGFREVTFLVKGAGAYRWFKYEGGGHRVQRVPKTETQGRTHTSLCTVAVLPEVEDVEVELKTEDIRIDRYCSSGPGGQSVNTTYSAVRVTHLPTGITAQCQDEKSQHKNKDKALRVLRSRLYERMRAERDQARLADRANQIGSGDRSMRIRTYNFPQNRVTDHRIGFSQTNLENILLGELDPFVAGMRQHEMEQKVKDLGAE